MLIGNGWVAVYKESDNEPNTYAAIVMWAQKENLVVPLRRGTGALVQADDRNSFVGIVWRPRLWNELAMHQAEMKNVLAKDLPGEDWETA